MSTRFGWIRTEWGGNTSFAFRCLVITCSCPKSLILDGWICISTCLGIAWCVMPHIREAWMPWIQWRRRGRGWRCVGISGYPPRAIPTGASRITKYLICNILCAYWIPVAAVRARRTAFREKRWWVVTGWVLEYCRISWPGTRLNRIEAFPTCWAISGITFREIPWICVRTWFTICIFLSPWIMRSQTPY